MSDDGAAPVSDSTADFEAVFRHFSVIASMIGMVVNHVLANSQGVVSSEGPVNSSQGVAHSGLFVLCASNCVPDTLLRRIVEPYRIRMAALIVGITCITLYSSYFLRPEFWSPIVACLFFIPYVPIEGVRLALVSRR